MRKFTYKDFKKLTDNIEDKSNEFILYAPAKSKFWKLLKNYKKMKINKFRILKKRRVK